MTVRFVWRGNVVRKALLPLAMSTAMAGSVHAATNDAWVGTRTQAAITRTVAPATAATTAAAHPTWTLSLHGAPTVDAATVSPLEASKPVHVEVSLNLRNVDELEAFLQAVNDPASPQYHHFLTPAQFKARYAPSDADVARVMQIRDGAPLLVVDVAVPRDVDPTAADLPGVTLLDMDDLRAFAEAGQAERRREVAGVRTMVGEELERYMAVSSAREVAPLVAALREQAEDVRRAELDRFRSKLGELDERQVEAVEALTHGIVAKLLHQPTVRVKQFATGPEGAVYAEALRELFDLDPAIPSAVVKPGTALGEER